SSRRRHTRFSRDWSSDVCSSDLGASLLRLQTASLVLADAEGSEPVEPDAFREAEPDPFCLLEDTWLRHLELTHRDVVGLLSRHEIGRASCRERMELEVDGRA